MSNINNEYAKLTAELGDIVLKLDILQDKQARLMHALKQLKFFEENAHYLRPQPSAPVVPIKPQKPENEA